MSNHTRHRVKRTRHEAPRTAVPPSNPNASIPPFLMELGVKERTTPTSLDELAELVAGLVDDWAELAYAAIPVGPPDGMERTAFTLMFEHIGAGVRSTMLDVVLPTLIGLHNSISARNNLGRLPITIPGPPAPVADASPFAQFGTEAEIIEAPAGEFEETADAVAARLRAAGLTVLGQTETDDMRTTRFTR